MSDWTKEDYKHIRKDLKKSGYFLPVSNGKIEALGWIADIPLGYDLLQVTRENPLFKKWNCKHTNELKQLIEENVDLLKEIREKQRLRIFKNLNKCDTQQEKRELINHVLSIIKTQTKTPWLENLESELADEREKRHKGLTKPTKTKRVKIFSDGFVSELSAGKFSTNSEVISALRKIEPKYEPNGKKQKEPLKNDGTPYEKRICIALADIFEIKENEPIHWTTIRDHYRDNGKKIG